MELFTSTTKRSWILLLLLCGSLAACSALSGGSMALRLAGASTNLPGQQAACVASRRGSSRPVSLTSLRCSSADVGDLQEQAAKAKADAEEAERRLASLKAASASAKKAAPPPVAKKVVVEEEPVELMDEEQLAKEMSELLGGLQKRGGGGKTDPLTGSKWALDLDFGREKGTWMDAKWGASGRRVKRGLAVEFASGGKVKGVESYTFGLKQTLKGVKGGEWKVEGAFPGEKVKFFVDHDGFTAEESGCDIDLPPGRLFLSANTMGGKLGRQGGMSIEQFRFYVRRERRMVGIFSHSQISDE